MRSERFDRFAGLCGIAAGIGGVAYSASFVTFLQSGNRFAAKLASLLLMVGGLVVMPVLIAVFDRVRGADQGFALWAVGLGVVAAAGTAVHGAYDLANFIKPPATVAADLPNAVDPRGLLTFGLTGVAVLIVAWLIVEGAALPRRLGHLGVLSGLLLVWIYLGRLTILNPKNPALLSAAVLSGFVVAPAWFLWVGSILWRGSSRPDPDPDRGMAPPTM